MNKKLKEVYEREFKNLAPKLIQYNKTVEGEHKATNPFLIKVTDDYTNYKNKIMIFGQETNTWCNECGFDSSFSNNIEKSLDVYENFYINGGIKKYRGPFWNEFKRIKNHISSKKNTTFIYNNINKIGKIGVGNLKAINDIQFDYFNVVKEEINILHPTVVLLFTGHDYDFFIEKNIGRFNQKKLSDSIFQLEFEKAYKNIKFFKTYHPNALYHQKKNRIVINELIDRIEKICV